MHVVMGTIKPPNNLSSEIFLPTCWGHKFELNFYSMLPIESLKEKFYLTTVLLLKIPLNVTLNMHVLS